MPQYVGKCSAIAEVIEMETVRLAKVIYRLEVLESEREVRRMRLSSTTGRLSTGGPRRQGSPARAA